jgi:hypothetical protein
MQGLQGNFGEPDRQPREPAQTALQWSRWVRQFERNLMTGISWPPPLMKMSFGGTSVPSDPVPFLRLCVFNELAAFSEEKKK